MKIESKIDFGMLMNSILCTFICWLIINNFVFPIGIIKFVLLELFLTTMHQLFSWAHLKISSFLNKNNTW